VGALWQYIKSNRLQESEDKYGAGGTTSSFSGVGGIQVGANYSTRQTIIANQELLEIFGKDDKIQFHQIMEKLNNHLSDIDPITIKLHIGGKELFESEQYKAGGKFQRFLHSIEVDVFSENQSKLVEFLTKNNAEFSGDQMKQVNKLESFHSVHGYLTSAIAMSVNKHGQMNDSHRASELKKREKKAASKILD